MDNNSNILKQDIKAVQPKELSRENLELPRENLEQIMADLEQKVNPKSGQEGIVLTAAAVISKDPSIILGPMERGAKEFEERAGRPMTYMEMRMMWG